ncbi:HD domain-containing protein [bacterium]|nr:HD domain-containing protein [bacterium]
MITQNNVQDLKKWFATYVHAFVDRFPESRHNLLLKSNHSINVCKEILHLGKDLELAKEDLRLLEITGLFHDIGRFEQYAQYKTFVDAKSENHASLGVRVLWENKVFDCLEDESERELILRAISYHNRIHLPDHESEKCLMVSKMLRDADKLDIWRLVTDYYHNPQQEKNPGIELDLPDHPHISEEAVSDIMSERLVKKSSMKTLNDFKLLKIGWVYDLNYPKTIQLVLERHYIKKLLDVLPRSEKTTRVAVKIQSFLEKYRYLSMQN